MEDTLVLEHGYGELSGTLEFFFRPLMSEIEGSSRSTPYAVLEDYVTTAKSNLG